MKQGLKVDRWKDTDNMKKILRSIGEKLPQQNPLDQFIHNNLLMPFESNPFWVGVEKASHLYQGATTKNIEWYFSKWKKGIMSEAALTHAAYSFLAKESESLQGDIHLWARCLARALSIGPRPPAANLSKKNEAVHSEPAMGTHVSPVQWPLDVFEWLCRVAETFLDQGIAHWKAPGRESLITFVGILLKPYRICPGSWQHRLAMILGDLNKSPSDALVEQWEALGLTEIEWELWLLRLAFSIRGWSGMFNRMAVAPQMFLRPVEVDLADWLFLLHTLALVLGYEAKDCEQLMIGQGEKKSLQQSDELAHQIYFQLLEFQDLTPKEVHTLKLTGTLDAMANFFRKISVNSTQIIWHEAFEWSSYQKVMGRISRHHRSQKSIRPETGVSQSISVGRPLYQALFCIDDREESLRRHLEETDQGVATYGVLGNFGLDMAFVRPHHPRPVQQCPPVVTPSRTLLSDLPPYKQKTKHLNSISQFFSSGISYLHYYHFYGSKTIGGGVVSSLFLGSFISFLLLVKGLIPYLVHRLMDFISHVAHKQVAHGDEKISLRRYEHPTYGPCGYTIEEQSNILMRVLKQAGIASMDFADLLVVIGHTSTGVNNPFQKAYGCGACSGNSGGVNARVFASMFNNREVRNLLKIRGFIIPEKTVAVAAVHDTNRETLCFFKTEHEYLPRELRLIEDFEAKCVLALERNAEERAPTLGLLSSQSGFVNGRRGPNIWRQVHRRSLDLGQIRSEYGHSQTHFAYFGPRSSTLGLCLERKSFLISYDSNQDQNGSVLRELMHGALPVVANITLDYFFSALDTRGFGSHNKVPLNISAMIGLIQGSRGDLQIGLAEQMVEIHEPVRPMVFVEAPQPWITESLQGHLRLCQLVRNSWIHLVQVCPEAKVMSLLTPQLTWQPL